MKLSVLDQSPIRSGGTPSDTLLETVELAKACEQYGYHRYWMAEHHATPALAGPAPEIMVAHVAAATSSMRIGTGGVMLSHYSPLKVAETFNLLETLYPGRIDLGIGRAPGSDQLTALALAYGSEIGIEYFPTRIADMMAFMGTKEPTTEIFKRIKIVPKPDVPPQLWLLGSSDQSALMAAKFGLAFSFAQFITPVGGAAVLDAYRQGFEPSEFYAKPEASIGTFMICAETEEEARRLGSSRDYALVRRARGQHGPFPSVAEAEAQDYTEADLQYIAANSNRSFYGDPDQCYDWLMKLSEVYGIDEVVVLTICHDAGARRRSYELLAERVLR
ncbi:MAG: LLM class flavin-dependent oxidoreductase [Rhodospirillales bacterium]|nr:LLM class flavin-dependent oxidoreductase [Rhodospirillales bacterium]